MGGQLTGLTLGHHCWNSHGAYCIPNMLIVLATAPPCAYFFSLLGTYDEGILARQQHFYLLLGASLSICMLVYYIFGGIFWIFYSSDQGNGDDVTRSRIQEARISVLAFIVFLASLIWVLIHFEQIDLVQQLENEIHKLEEQSRKVEKQREDMVEFWEGMQQLTDLWLHRTVPRLDLLKEVQSQLEDAPPKDSLAYMKGANQRLEDLESHLPELSAWRANGQLTLDSKKSFAESILRLCQEDNLPTMMSGLNYVITDRLPHPPPTNMMIMT